MAVRPAVGHNDDTMTTTARSALLSLAATALLLLVAAPAGAQIGVPNAPFVAPGPLPEPFGPRPHPFNDPHPVEPWSPFDRVVRVFQVPARTVVVPMDAAEPATPSAAVEWQQVTLPSYQVTETLKGWLVHNHWGVAPVGNAFYWTWRPTYFVAK
jgi:hypothetical protein